MNAGSDTPRPDAAPGPGTPPGSGAVPDAGPSMQPGPPVQTPDAEQTWHRVHPVSPLVRGWIALVAIIFVAGRENAEVFLEQGGAGFEDFPFLWAALALLVVLLVIAGAFYLSWRFTRYQLTAEHVRVHSGVLFRQQRQARLDRVQAIDVIQPLLARVFGLAELRFEVADSGESAVRLAYLRLSDAKKLRAVILARASGAPTPAQASAGADAGSGDEIDEAPEQLVVTLRPGRVIASTLLSGTTLFLLVFGLGGAATVAISTGEPIGLAVVVPVLIGTAGSYWSQFNTGFNFAAAHSPDGLRIRYGLLDTRAQTVPPGRIQAISVAQPVLWRFPGWYRISVNVAGYGGGDADARTRLLPAGTLDEVFRILALALPDPGTPDARHVFTAGLTGSGADGGFTTTPRRARWLAPLAWRRNGFTATDTALLARSGRLRRQLVIVPHERTQSMALTQGPLNRRFGVADLRLHTTVGPVSPRIIQQDTATAQDLFARQAVRARDARRRDRSERWLERRPPAPSVPFQEQNHEQP